MKIWNCIALFAPIILASGDAPEEAQAHAGNDTAVVKLTADTFKSFIEEHPMVLAEFYAPWCGYCKMVGPELVKAAATFNETRPDIKIAQIDCTVETKLCGELKIQGYPTMMIGRQDPDALTPYKGPREAEGIVAYMLKQTLPAIQQPNTTAEIDAFLANNTALFQIGEPTKKQSETFETYAKKARDDYFFVLVQEPKLVKYLLSKLPKVKTAKSGAVYVTVLAGSPADAEVFDGEFTEEALTSYNVGSSIPFFGNIDSDTYIVYMLSKAPLAYYFHNTTEDVESKRAFFEKLGRQYRHKINFVALDASIYGRHAETLNMDPEIVPLFAIDDIPTGKKFGLSKEDYPEGPTTDNIVKFLKQYLAGKVEPTIKSEPIPTPEEAAKLPVVKIVGKNYADVIGDVSKDILVEFYAPWCGHCKKLMPVWEKLAKIYADNKLDNVVIAQMDHTANSVVGNIDIQGYPTLMLFPANGEVDDSGMRKPKTFEGARELKAFVEYIKKEGAHKVDATELVPEEEPEAEVEEAINPEKVIEVEDIKGAEDEEDVEHDEL